MRIPLLGINITRNPPSPLTDDQVLSLYERLKQNQERRLKVTMADLKNKIPLPEQGGSFEQMLEMAGVGVWVYSATMAIGEDSASLQWGVFNEDGEEVDNPFPERPNEIMTWTFMRHITQNYLDLTGNAYWWWNREEDQFFPLRPSRVQVVPNKAGNAIIGYAYKKSGFTVVQAAKNGEKRYWTVKKGAMVEFTYKDFMNKIQRYEAYAKSGESTKAPFNKDDWIPLKAEDVFHFKYPHPFNDYYGLSPLSPLILSFTTEMFARKWNQLFFENGAIPPVILSFPEGLNEDDFKRLQKHYTEKHGGLRNVWKPYLIEGSDVNVEVVEMNHTDMGFLNLLQMTREDTLAVLKVPPIKVGIWSFANTSGRSAGAREQREQYWTDTIIPRVLMQQDVINTGMDFGDGNELRFDIFSIPALQPDLFETARSAKLAIDSGLTGEQVVQYIWKPLFPDIEFQQSIPQADGDKLLAFPKKKDSSSEEIRKELWQEIIKGFEEREDALFDWVVEMFRAQQVRVLNATRREFNKGIDDLVKVIPSLRTDEDNEFQQEAETIFLDMTQDAGDEALRMVGVEISFDVLNPTVVEFIRNKSFRFAQQVNTTTLERLREQLTAAATEGESITEIAKRVRRVFSDGIRGTKDRSLMIARTEATSLSNGGAILAYQQNEDLIESKEWLSSRDNRVRPSHTAADGQVVGLNQPFSVGGSLMMHPGDPQAPPEEVIRCRCAMVAVLKE